MATKECSNRKKCPCTYPGCSRNGRCCECLAYHLKSNELPGCCFSPEVERTYDRSFARFVTTQGKGPRREPDRPPGFEGKRWRDLIKCLTKSSPSGKRNGAVARGGVRNA